MEIVNLFSEDWEKFKKIRLEAIEKDGLAFKRSHRETLAEKDEFWIKPLEKPDNFLFFAKDNNEIVGMAAAYLEEGELCKHVAYIWGVYVQEAFRGQGIARKLLETLITKLKQGGVVKANLVATTTQTNAIKLYESLGFQTVGIAHKEAKINGEFYDERLMEKIF